MLLCLSASVDDIKSPFCHAKQGWRPCHGPQEGSATTTYLKVCIVSSFVGNVPFDAGDKLSWV